ncbi:hypothetical protein J2W20_002357 [Sinomonas atrocyanea]|uniref:hypothetical protein n=1 Tax=Sinomonas atrocyanea TaxID=37927 RepID=UPI0027800DFD|nr:hypothetical protein [Sinomonas atrocyanea]MDQ0260453.1 hypothetical protein [Sinomonas atrocyanea]
MTVKFIDCYKLPLNSDGDLEVLEDVASDLIIVLGFDALLRARRGEAWMRQLRPMLFDAMAGGAALIISSKLPQKAYPAIDGSGLATDCYATPVPRLTIDHMVGMDEVRAKDILAVSMGYPGPASRLLAGGGSGASLLEGSDIFIECLAASIVECGAETLSSLESCYLHGISLPEGPYSHPDDVQSTLIAAGMAEVDYASDAVNVLPWLSVNTICRAIVKADLMMLDAPASWGEIANKLFRIERSLRAIISRNSVYSSRREQFLESRRKKIRDNYSNETGVAAPSLEQLAIPEKWLDLSDLLDLLAELAEGGRINGMSSKQWAKAKADLLPVRNRIQHMRLPRSGDAEVVRAYLSRLGSS